MDMEFTENTTDEEIRQWLRDLPKKEEPARVNAPQPTPAPTTAP